VARQLTDTPSPATEAREGRTPRPTRRRDDDGTASIWYRVGRVGPVINLCYRQGHPIYEGVVIISPVWG